MRGVIVVEDPVGEQTAARPWPVPAIEQVANRPIAHHVLDALEDAGVKEVVVAASARSANAVRECLARRDRPERSQLRFVQQRAPLELASALSLVAPVIDESPCLVHAAGGLLAEPLAPLADCLNDGPDAVLMVHQTAVPDQRLSAALQSLLRLAELDPARSTLELAGVWAFGPGAMRRAAAQPGAANVDLSFVAERLMAAGGTIQVRLADVWRAYGGQALDLLELNRIVLDRIETELPPSSRDGNRIEGRVRIHERASVRASVIVGPVVIGPDARVNGAYIGPYTAIGAGACIEGAEIERSIIAAGASVTHVGRRVTASVVGPNARVFSDFSLPRALRLRVGADAEVGLG